METSSETKKPSSDMEETRGDGASTQNNKGKNARPSNKVVIIAAAVVVLVVTVATLVIVAALRDNTTAEEPPSRIGYSTDAQVMLTQEELQAALNNMTENGNIGLLYKNNAYSGDGLTFECYIVNSATNRHDMFLTIFADLEMTDQLFLSQLIPPGSGFNQITLERALEKGDHTVYVCLTQVARDEETGEEYINGQVFHTMDFHVE